jgi:hypothetical protein
MIRAFDIGVQKTTSQDRGTRWAGVVERVLVLGNCFIGKCIGSTIELYPGVIVPYLGTRIHGHSDPSRRASD